MNIYIDESGSFASTPNIGAWNVVAGVATSESSRRHIERAVKSLKLTTSSPYEAEIKLNLVDETRYAAFLNELTTAHVILFATATDAGLNTTDRILKHQATQVAKIRENLPRMRFESGRKSIELLANELAVVSPQLYAQLVCQVDLLHSILDRAINYFAQRVPASLAAFRWRIDQKNTTKTTYEIAFEKIAPTLLQTRSFKHPFAHIEGFDYRHFQPYLYSKEKVPDYLEADYGIKVEEAVDIGKLIHGDLKFEDSKKSVGIQVADLLASGIRRTLRGDFKDNEVIARALGRLTLQNKQGKYPINLVSFADSEVEVDSTASSTVKAMAATSRRMFT